MDHHLVPPLKTKLKILQIQIQNLKSTWEQKRLMKPQRNEDLQVEVHPHVDHHLGVPPLVDLRFVQSHLHKFPKGQRNLKPQLSIPLWRE